MAHLNRLASTRASNKRQSAGAVKVRKRRQATARVGAQEQRTRRGGAVQGRASSSTSNRGRARGAQRRVASRSRAEGLGRLSSSLQAGRRSRRGGRGGNNRPRNTGFVGREGPRSPGGSRAGGNNRMTNDINRIRQPSGGRVAALRASRQQTVADFGARQKKRLGNLSAAGQKLAGPAAARDLASFSKKTMGGLGSATAGPRPGFSKADFGPGGSSGPRNGGFNPGGRWGGRRGRPNINIGDIPRDRLDFRADARGGNNRRPGFGGRGIRGPRSGRPVKGRSFGGGGGGADMTLRTMGPESLGRGRGGGPTSGRRTAALRQGSAANSRARTAVSGGRRSRRSRRRRR